MRGIVIAGMVLFFASSGLSAPIELGIGTRSQGMGGAFVGLADDASAVYWNPAGLGLTKKGEVRFMHWILSDVEDVSVQWFGLSHPKGIGLSWLRKGANLEQGRDNLTTVIAENRYSLSYGVSLSHNFIVGVTANRFSVESEIGGSSGFGIDAACLWLPNPRYFFQIGFLARNLSASMGDENFPTTYRMGFAWGPLRNLILAFDLSTKSGVDGREGLTYRWFGGIEWKIVEQFAIRMGFNTNHPLNFGTGFSLGPVILDYAYSSVKEGGLTNSHRIDLGYRF